MTLPKLEDDRLLTIKEVAEYLRVDPKTVRRRIDDGDLAAHKVGRPWRIAESDLRKYLRDRWRG